MGTEARLLAEHAVFIGFARLLGRLYLVEDYPAAGPAEGSGEHIHGELWQLSPVESAAVLAALDDYEGSSFERGRVPVVLDDGRRVEAWVYLYLANTEDLPVIGCGDWLEHLAQVERT